MSKPHKEREVKVNTKNDNASTLIMVPSVIAHARKVLGWTQAKLAKKMGTSQTVIARAERYEREGKWTKLSLKFYMRFCEATGMGMTAPDFADLPTPKPAKKK